MAAWESGKSDIACEKCGAVHVVEWTIYPVKESGVVRCEVRGCGGVVKDWKGTKDYGPATLKEE